MEGEPTHDAFGETDSIQAKEEDSPTQKGRIDTVANLDEAIRELEKTDPELFKKLRHRQQAVADCRRRASSNRRLLDTHLD